MKADILRRAEAISDDEEEVEDSEIFGTDAAAPRPSKGKGKAVDGAPRAADLGPDDEDDVVHLRVAGDGEDSGDSDEEDDAEDREEERTPETILELAYLRDPKLFDRDAATRRSKARDELKAQTGESSYASYYLPYRLIIFAQAGTMNKSKAGKLC
jgi:activating signal cointegrator complex subunit 2